MFKLSKTSVVVDSVDRALKFYTEKLLFSIVELRVDKESGLHVNYAEIRKGKCHIILRLPFVDELAEFSMVRRCNGRAIGIVMEMKKGIERYFYACKKKRLNVISNLKESQDGYQVFQVRDPFGIRLTFIQATQDQPEILKKSNNFCGMDISGRNIEIKSDSDVPADMVTHLKSIGISRRTAKKYIKGWAKARKK